MPRDWAVFLDAQTWIWLGGGLLVTLRVAAVVVVVSFATGTLLALIRLAPSAVVRWLAIAYIQVVRGVPVFLVIVFTYFALPKIGAQVPVAESVTLALTIYATALIAEVVRGGIQAVPIGQIHAARSLGLSGYATFRHVVLPQALRIMVPALVSQYIILIKETSIGGVVGLDELLRRAGILYNGFQNPLQCLIVVALMYFAFLYPLSAYSRRLELRQTTRELLPSGEQILATA